jgi:hypothetical protein
MPLRRPPLRLLRLANPFVRSVLRSPAHRMLSGSLMVLTYTGRRSGRRFAIPVMYALRDDDVVALASSPEAKQWWRTFETGAPATLRVAGRVVEAHGRLLAGPEAREALTTYLTRFPRAAGALGASAGAPDESLDDAAARVALVAFAPDDPAALAATEAPGR